jgi:hypothetical protein
MQVAGGKPRGFIVDVPRQRGAPAFALKAAVGLVIDPRQVAVLRREAEP